MIQERFKLQPKQRQVYNAMSDDDLKVIGYGGAKGGGKSALLRMLLLLVCAKHPGIRTLLFRRTYNELGENHIQRLFQDYPWMRKWYNKTESMLTFPNGSTIRFGYAEYDSDIVSYNGKEYEIIGVDQAEQCTVYQLGMLKAANRSTTGRKPKFILTFNPGGISADYLKSKFVDRALTQAEVEEGWL